MGRHTQFPECNFTWKGWPEEGDRPAVGDLATYRDGHQAISCWEMSAAEIAEIQRTGKVWLHVLGSGHPPVAVMGHAPFADPPTAEVIANEG